LNLSNKHYHFIVSIKSQTTNGIVNQNIIDKRTINRFKMVS
jgi:hypothetical protein